MRTLRQLRRSPNTPPLAALVACAIAVAVFSRPAATTVSAAPLAGYSGQELADGLFFGVGPVADRLPEIYGGMQLAEGAAAEAAAEARGLLYANITSSNPEFFEEFSGAMQSGNHVEIAAGLDEAGEAIRDALLSSAPGFADAYGAQASANPQGWYWAIVFFIATAVLVTNAVAISTATAVTTATAVHVAVYVATSVTKEDDDPEELMEAAHSGFNDKNSELRYDYLVSLIANRLAVA